MAGTVGQGGTIRLEARFRAGSGELIDPITPLVDILNPSSVAVVTDAVPTRDSTGLYHYDYTVAGDAPLGGWSAHWTGVINSVPVSGDDSFTVVEAGSVDPVADAPAYSTFAPIRPGQWFAGHLAAFRFTVPDASSSWTMRWTLRRGSESGPALIQKTTGISAGVDYVDVSLTAAESIALLPGAYWHTLERTGSGSETLLAYGWAIIERVAA